MNIEEAKSLIKTFCTKTGNLNTTANVVRTYNSYTSDFRQLLNASDDISIKTMMYCILHDEPLHKCKTCGKSVDVYSFISGEFKNFCSHECSGSYKRLNTKGTLFTDYASLLNDDGTINSSKIRYSLNANSIKAMKETAELQTDDIRTLLYSIIHGKDKLKSCIECNSLIDITSFTDTPYLHNQNYCSKVCRNKNEAFKENLRVINNNKILTEDYHNSIGIPRFEEKKRIIEELENIKINVSFEEYQKAKILLKSDARFACTCNVCNNEFTSRLIYNPYCHKCNPNSKPQKELLDFIESFGYKTLMNDRQLIKPYELDIVIPELKIAIEYDGLYWHRDKNDYHKYEMCKNVGYRLIKIYSDEPLSIVKSRLAAIVNNSENKIHARKCKVVVITNSTYKEFMSNNHIQGTVNASVKYGLEYDSELVSVMSFGKCRYDKNFEWELLRFANRLNTTVVGGASKLFKHFIKTESPKSVLSYCDVRWGTGNMYEKLGFAFSHKTDLNYYWFKKKRESRIKYQKHKLSKIFDTVDMSLSESEIMAKQGFSKIYDFGNYVYHWKSN